MRYAPRLDPIREELAVDGRLDDRAVRLHKRKEAAGVALPVDIDEVLVTPVVTEVHAAVVEAVRSNERVEPTGEVVPVDNLHERDVHDVCVQLRCRNLRVYIVRRARWVREDQRPVRPRRVAGHPHEPV